jgi:hypothetical protein
VCANGFVFVFVFVFVTLFLLMMGFVFLCVRVCVGVFRNVMRVDVWWVGCFAVELSLGPLYFLVFQSMITLSESLTCLGMNFYFISSFFPFFLPEIDGYVCMCFCLFSLKFSEVFFQTLF